jgi:hypothetical protein
MIKVVGVILLKMPLLSAILSFFTTLNRDRRKSRESGTFIERYGKTLCSLAVILMCGIILVLRYTGIIEIS